MSKLVKVSEFYHQFLTDLANAWKREIKVTNEIIIQEYIDNHINELPALLDKGDYDGRGTA